MREANKIAFEKLTLARPVLIGCGTAGEVMPGFRKNLILHSGPPVEFGNMRGPHRMGIVGAAMLEGLARDKKEAVGMIESGEIELGCANDFHSGGPGAGITSYSMAMLSPAFTLALFLAGLPFMAMETESEEKTERGISCSLAATASILPSPSAVNDSE